MTNPITGRPYSKGCFSREVVETLLLLVDVEFNPLDLAAWTPDQLKEAGNWALRTHLRASDNNTVRVPAKPAHVGNFRALNPNAKTVMDL